MKKINLNNAFRLLDSSTKIATKIVMASSFLALFCVPAYSQSKEILDSEIGLEKIDAKMNDIYDRILEAYAGDTLFLSKLSESQRIWESFRNAELAMRFPEGDDNNYYGSIYEQCAAHYMAELTQERTEKLKIWLEGIEEGDVCSGSIKFKSN